MRPVIVMTQTSEFKRNDACILHRPFIRVEPLSFDLNLLNVNYDWLIFSSKNAVKFFQPYLKHVNVDKIAVIGEKTANYCKSLGLKVSFCPKDYSQEGFLEAFYAEEGSKILLPSSEAARPLLQDELYNQNYIVQKIDLYKPVPHTDNISDVKNMINNGEIDAVAFASSSAVRYYFNHKMTVNFDHYFVIGLQTLETLHQYHAKGMVSETQTLESLVSKIIESWETNAI
ncbi:uroporphyrinogen-III synthase [Staphylococcus xylosus]|uniref:uroporphyrinogen-III synthase n=1 Tax=Staphylococcus xylosus TaxID=1288 RepID=UPI002DBCEF25|nr:uroporphyrinogen-III synthase [Staphylococcus xylosus]MEB7831797.1 uroporphyrinogen-III synthase [Staphylococcus xylosus]